MSCPSRLIWPTYRRHCRVASSPVAKLLGISIKGPEQELEKKETRDASLDISTSASLHIQLPDYYPSEIIAPSRPPDLQSRRASHRIAYRTARTSLVAHRIALGVFNSGSFFLLLPFFCNGCADFHISTTFGTCNLQLATFNVQLPTCIL